MRRFVLRGIAATAFVCGTLVPSVAAAANPTGAPPNTEAGQINSELARTAEPNLGYLARPAAQLGIVDELNHAALGITPPRH